MEDKKSKEENLWKMKKRRKLGRGIGRGVNNNSKLRRRKGCGLEKMSKKRRVR